MNRTRIKPVLLSAIFFLVTFSLSAQVNKVPNLKLYDSDPLHFGFILAANQMDFVIKTRDDIHQIYFKGLQIPERDLKIPADSAMVYGVEAIPNLGFTVGIVGDKRIGEYFNLRFIPSLSFGSRELSYDVRAFSKDESTQKDTVARRVLNQKVNSTFVEFPLYLKYKSKRVHNVRGYIYTGLKYSFDLASQANKTEQNNYEPKLYQSDSYYVLGAGADIYMNWFKFGVELSMSYGMRDILLRENNMYTDAIESLKSKIFMLTFTFE